MNIKKYIQSNIYNWRQLLSQRKVQGVEKEVSSRVSVYKLVAKGVTELERDRERVVRENND